MKDSAKSTGRKLEGFLSKLSELVDALPSQETKSQLDRELDVLIRFLQDFRSRLKSLPTIDGRDGISSTIETLNDYVRVAESDPVMSRVLGLSLDRDGPKRPSQNLPTEHDRREAKALTEELKDLSHEEVERKLTEGKKYKIAMLRQIGGELGLKFPSKSTRPSMVEKIAKKIDNLRGYDSLRHGHDERL